MCVFVSVSVSVSVGVGGCGCGWVWVVQNPSFQRHHRSPKPGSSDPRIICKMNRVLCHVIGTCPIHVRTIHFTKVVLFCMPRNRS